MESSLRQWIIKHIMDYKDVDELVQAADIELGVTRKQVRDTLSKLRIRKLLPVDLVKPAYKSRLSENRSTTIPSSPSKKSRKIRMGVDVSEIKSEYDDDGKLSAGIESLGTSLIKDNDFRIELGISYQRWRSVADRTKFAKYRIDLKGKRFHGLYWGRQEVITELRKSIEIA